LLVLLLAFLFRPDSAQSNSYQGKTITIISGTSAGSAYDTYARVIAGADLEKLAKDIVVQRPKVIDRMKRLLGK
jgi:tripartite-type tricarboxylate transporter receptor subunit TctC